MSSLVPSIVTKELALTESKTDALVKNNDLAHKRMKLNDNNNTEIKRRVSQSMSWYRLSADKTDARTQISLGRMYEIGRGVPIDYHTALEWYLKAAKQNSKAAFSNIGSLFLQGKGVPVDAYKALEWFRKDDSEVVKIKTLKDQGVYITRSDQKKSLDQLIEETEHIINAELKVENKRLRYSTLSLEEQLNNQNLMIAALEKGIEIAKAESQANLKNRQDTIETLERENRSLQTLSIQERQSVVNEMQLLKMTNVNMEQQLKERNGVIKALKQENQTLQAASKRDSQDTGKMVTTLENLLQSKTNEIKLLKKNMTFVLKSQNRKKRKLEKDNKKLKREIKQEHVEETTTEIENQDQNTSIEEKSDMEVDIQDEAVDINSVTPSGSEDDEKNNKKTNFV